MSGATNSPLNCRSSGKALLTVKSIISRLQTALEILQSRNSGQVRWRSSEFKALVTTLEGGIRSLNEKCGHTGIFSDPRIQYEDVQMLARLADLHDSLDERLIGGLKDEMCSQVKPSECSKLRDIALELVEDVCECVDQMIQGTIASGMMSESRLHDRECSGGKRQNNAPSLDQGQTFTDRFQPWAHAPEPRDVWGSYTEHRDSQEQTTSTAPTTDTERKVVFNQNRPAKVQRPFRQASATRFKLESDDILQECLANLKK